MVRMRPLGSVSSSSLMFSLSSTFFSPRSLLNQPSTMDLCPRSTWRRVAAMLSSKNLKTGLYSCPGVQPGMRPHGSGTWIRYGARIWAQNHELGALGGMQVLCGRMGFSLGREGAMRPHRDHMFHCYSAISPNFISSPSAWRHVWVSNMNDLSFQNA